MSKGFVVLAQGESYIREAYALALSIKVSQKKNKLVSLITSDNVPLKYQKVFDKIIEIPWGDDSGTNSRYKAENRWKIYHASPYDETIVLDTDMLVLEDLTSWWDYCLNYPVHYCSTIKNYKLETVVDTFHRKTFIANNLTSPYSALHYFKKSKESWNFYKTLEFVCKNWEWCYTTFAPKEYQNWLSMDLAVAIAIEITGMHNDVIGNQSLLDFIHMKIPLQGWVMIPESWKDNAPYFLNSKGDLVVGNIKQSKVFHYVEQDFLTDRIIFQFERLLDNA